MEYIDLSFVIGAIILIVILIFAKKILPIIQAAMPPALQIIIKWLADSVVNAIEVEYGGTGGEEKRELAFASIMNMIQPLVDCLEKYGFTFDAHGVYDAIEAAWNQMNTNQIAAGIKKIQPADE